MKCQACLMAVLFLAMTCICLQNKSGCQSLYDKAPVCMDRQASSAHMQYCCLAGLSIGTWHVEIDFLRHLQELTALSDFALGAKAVIAVQARCEVTERPDIGVNTAAEEHQGQNISGHELCCLTWFEFGARPSLHDLGSVTHDHHDSSIS